MRRRSALAVAVLAVGTSLASGEGARGAPAAWTPAAPTAGTSPVPAVRGEERTARNGLAPAVPAAPAGLISPTTATTPAPTVGAAPSASSSSTTVVSDLLDRELESARRAYGQVETQLADRRAAARRRSRVAYKLLRGAGSPLTVAPERRMAVARSRATARLLLARDRAESAQLSDELGLLTAAVARIERDRAAPIAPIPSGLIWPAAGAVARRFGILVHERSGATLARRGIDLEVAAEAQVVAPAEGVIRYSGPIRGLDHGVIIDHGGYWTVIAKLSPLAFVPDLRVARGALVGHPRRHRVYFEVRLAIGPGGVPIDPEPLLAPPAAR